jgi:pyrrolidone-carboxylate peptidase
MWCLVTGFGPYSKLKNSQNPSDVAVQSLPDKISVPLLDDELVVDVVKRTLRVSYSTADAFYKDFPSSVGRTKAPVLILHVGVNCNITCVHLEEGAVNQAEGIDVDGCESVTGTVTKERSGCRVCSELGLPGVAQSVRLRCQKFMQEPRIDISQDAGQYLCNYIYYKACKWCASQKMQDSALGPLEKHSCSSRTACLFVHIPMAGQPYSIYDLTCILNEIIIACLTQRLQATPLLDGA